MNPSNPYGEIEIGIHRIQPDACEVELRATDPLSEGEIAPARGEARFNLKELEAIGKDRDSAQYATTLTGQLFADPAITSFYKTNKDVFDSRGFLLRLRLLIGPSVPELHGLHWELLLDPIDRQPLVTSERVLFSRFMRSRDWRVVKLRPKANLKALIAVSGPPLRPGGKFAPVDTAGEIARATAALAGIQSKTLGLDQPLTLNSLAKSLREGVDILYLVCHGTIQDDLRPCLLFQNEAGNGDLIPAAGLAARIAELQETPRLVVLASCESAGSEFDAGAAQSALAPRLADAGVPAVIAMQGKITMETVKRAMPVFFQELMTDGQIDRAMAVARGVVRERADSWMPALFLRLKNGRIWYEPGFGAASAGVPHNEFEKWKSICRRVHKGQFIPILGPELGEDIFGGTRELAAKLAEEHAFPLAAHERTDLAKVTQYIGAKQDRDYVQGAVQDQFLRQISQRIGGGGPPRALPELLDIATQRCLSNPDHPYRILADLPASIYLNASYETMLFRSLEAAGKTPESIFASWRGKDVPRQPQPKIAPMPRAPWVYHVFGRFGKPDTMVLTEDDFFDYLIATSRLDLLLPSLVGRLMQSSLLFLGFRLDDWRFRVLFRMIVTRPGTETMRELSHVGVQVNPDEHSIADVDRARKYMEKYFGGGAGPEVSIYWGSAAEFLKELKQHLKETPAEPLAVAAQAGDDDW